MLTKKILLIWIFNWIPQCSFQTHTQSQTSALIFPFDVKHINIGQNVFVLAIVGILCLIRNFYFIIRLEQDPNNTENYEKLIIIKL